MPPKKQDNTKKSAITEKNTVKEAPKPKEKQNKSNGPVKELEKNTHDAKPNSTNTKNNNNNNEKNDTQKPQKDPPFVLSEDRALLQSLQTKMDTLHSQLDSIKIHLSKCEELSRQLKDARKVERANLIGSQKTIERYHKYKDEAGKKAADIKRHHSVKMNEVKAAEQLVLARWNLKQPFERSNRDHNISRLKSRLQQLQASFETSQLSLAEEKRQVAEIDGIHQLIVLVTEFHDKWKEVNVSDQREIQRLEENVQKLTQDIEEEKKIEEEYQKRVDNLTKKIDELKQRIETHQKEKTEIQDQIQQTNNEREAVRAKIDKQKAEWLAQRELERKKQEELRIKRQQEKEKQEKRKELLRLIKEAKTPPFQEDVSMCDRLLSFLQQLEKQLSKPPKSAKQSKKQPKEKEQPKEAQTEQPQEQKEAEEEKPIEQAPEQQKEEPAKEEAQEVTNNNAAPAEEEKAEQAPEPEPAPKDDNKPIQVDMEVILSLEQLSLKTPKNLGELRACIEQLKEKKKWFLKLRETIPPLPITEEMKALMEEMEKEKQEKKKQKEEKSKEAEKPNTEEQQPAEQATPSQEEKEVEKEQSQKVEQVVDVTEPTSEAAGPTSETESQEFKRPEVAEQTTEQVAADSVPTAEL